MAFQVEVVSPEAISYSGEADTVVCRTVGGGDIAFQPGHIPFVGVLQVWEARVLHGGEEEVFAVHRGFVQVSADKVTILSDVSERAGEIDVDRARASLEAAEAALADDPDDEAAVSARTRARLRLRVAGAEEATAH
jgi:F-type H+-transporting ATPase subunit epsilon